MKRLLDLIKRHKKPLIILLLALIAVVVVLFVRDERAHAPDSSSNQAETSEPVKEAAPAPEPEVAEVPPVPVAFNKSQYSLTDPTSIWIIANKQRPLNPLTYAPTDLVSVGGGQQMRNEASKGLSQLFMAAQAAGLKLNPLSGYRSYARQQVVYQNEVNTYGQAVADTESARPGHSEHQTGLAIDVGGGGCGIEDCFGNTAEGKWVAANGYKYGFIIRYPQGKQDITGYRYEPWHIRYVGSALSQEMKKKGVLTLEEFFGL